MKAKTRAALLDAITATLAAVFFMVGVYSMTALALDKFEQDQAVQIQIAQDYLAEYHDAGR